MPPLVILLVLLSACVHAGWNALLKRTRDPERAVAAVLAISAATSAVFALASRAPLPSTRGTLWCVAAGVLEAGYFVTLARALKRGPLGPVYTTVRGGALVVVWPISIAFLGERVTPAAIGGTLLVALGLLSTGASETPAADREGIGGPITRKLGWAFVCAIFVGAYHVAYKFALQSGAAPGFVVGLSLSVACALDLLALRRPGLRDAVAAWRHEPVAVTGAGLLASLGFIVFLYAMARAGAGTVTTLRNTSILFAQVIAALTGERPKRLGVVGAMLVTGGAALLAR